MNRTPPPQRNRDLFFKRLPLKANGTMKSSAKPSYTSLGDSSRHNFPFNSTTGMREFDMMMTRPFPILFLALLLLLLGGEAMARSFRVAQIPNGAVDQCLACHTSGNSGGPRNSFGTEIEQNFLSPPGAFGSVVWGPALAALDSDGDGVDNGTELNDPNGAWAAGQAAPGDPNDVTNPGVADTSPPNPVPGLSALAIWVLVGLLCGLALWKSHETKPLTQSISGSRGSRRPRR